MPCSLKRGRSHDVPLHIAAMTTHDPATRGGGPAGGRQPICSSWGRIVACCRAKQRTRRINRVVHLLTGQPTEVIHRCGDPSDGFTTLPEIRQLWPSDRETRHELHACKLLTMWINPVENFHRRQRRSPRIGRVFPGGADGGADGWVQTGGCRRVFGSCRRAGGVRRPGRLCGPETAIDGRGAACSRRSAPGRNCPELRPDGWARVRQGAGGIGGKGRRGVDGKGGGGGPDLSGAGHPDA